METLVNKLFSTARKEAGFTLIELLTVIVIIGILAAIAIPVFTSQRARAQDAQTISDVRNIAVQAETIMSDPTKNYDDVTKANIDFASSKNVSWNISGKTSLGGYCIVAKNTAGKKYTTDATALTYDSLAGGVGQSGKACNSTTNPVVPNGSTAVGSSTVTDTGLAVGSSVSFNNTSTGYTGTLQTFSVVQSGTYKIEAWGAKGGNSIGYPYVGGSGAYTSGTFSLNAGQSLTLLVGQSGEGYNGQNTGGGGGTFVTTGATSASTPLVVAGGGGGATSYNNGGNGSNSTAGTFGYYSGGANGQGAYSGSYMTYSENSAGGFYSAGSTGRSTDGKGFPGNGGNTDVMAGMGGYGGGASGTSFPGSAGAGGGYSGGGAGGGPVVAAGGGGSYVAASYNGATVTASEYNNTTKANAGQGKVVITRVS